MSKDAYGHLCTVTGAEWGLQGRTFVPVGDRINLPAGSVDLQVFTISMWICWNGGAGAVAKMLFSNHETDGTDGYMFRLESDETIAVYCYNTAGAIAFAAQSTGAVTVNTWHFVNLVCPGDGGTVQIYLDTVPDGSTTQTAITYGTSVTRIGYGSESNIPFAGIIGDVLVHSRVLSTTEMTHMRNSTTWRYI